METETGLAKESSEMSPDLKYVVIEEEAGSANPIGTPLPKRVNVTFGRSLGMIASSLL